MLSLLIICIIINEKESNWYCDFKMYNGIYNHCNIVVYSSFLFLQLILYYYSHHSLFLYVTIIL